MAFASHIGDFHIPHRAKSSKTGAILAYLGCENGWTGMKNRLVGRSRMLISVTEAVNSLQDTATRRARKSARISAAALGMFVPGP